MSCLMGGPLRSMVQPSDAHGFTSQHAQGQDALSSLGLAADRHLLRTGSPAALRSRGKALGPAPRRLRRWSWAAPCTSQMQVGLGLKALDA